jgi:hypothetical protein
MIFYIGAGSTRAGTTGARQVLGPHRPASKLLEDKMNIALNASITTLYVRIFKLIFLFVNIFLFCNGIPLK